MAKIDFSLRELRAFVALADLENFTRAAQAIHLSQPAFSALIRRLEEAVGVRLFDRNTRSVRLTPEGLLFEPSARQLLMDSERALSDISDQIELRKGRVHVAALPTISAGLLPAIFNEFRRSFPGIDLVLSDQLSEACIALVKEGRADFALVSNNARPGDLDELDARLLCKHHYHLVCPSSHPLLIEKRLTLRKIAQYPFIQMTRNNSVRQALEAAIHPRVMNTVLEVEHLGTVISMVNAGMGVSVVPTFTLHQFQWPTIATRPLVIPNLLRHIYVVKQRERSLSTASTAMLNLIVKSLGSLKI
jgi:LysR family transcriptional regulator, carnitine catabolism transcriptional activator